MKMQLLTGVGALALALAFDVSAPQEAYAGDECLLDFNDNGFPDAFDDDGSALTSGDFGALACGALAVAQGPGATAFGSDEDGDFLGAVAIGSYATAIGSDTFAIGNGASAFGGASLAVGTGATATGASSIAFGDFASAFGAGAVVGDPGAGDPANGSTAVGALSFISGNSDGSTAVGAGAGVVNGADNATAVGSGAVAGFDGSTALGAGASTTAANEMMFGTGNSLYTAPGITSAASLARQSGPTCFVTSDDAGHLACEGNVSDVFDELADLNAGVALAMSLDAPDLSTTENFAMRLGYGNFQGDGHAIGLSMIGNLGSTAGGTRFSADIGFGAGWADYGSHDSDATWGGKAGVQMAW